MSATDPPTAPENGAQQEPTGAEGTVPPASVPPVSATPQQGKEPAGATHDPLPETQRPTPVLPAVPGPSPIGTTLNDNYRIDRLIGEGGMGEVYEGEHIFTGNRVAIKMILRELSKDAGIVGLFRREARILFDLNDDAIVRYLDSFYHPGSDRYCLVMQFIDGSPLSDRLEESGALPLGDVITLARRLALGLSKAHGLGVIHRDLSPDNVMLRGGKVARATLIDFGIATAVDMSETTLMGQFAGKYRYVAPEQLGLHQGLIGPWTDIYGLGLLIAAAARGKALDMGRSFPEAVQARERTPDLSDLPPRLIPLIARMLNPQPLERPDSMAEVARLLDDPQALAVATPERTVIATPPGAARLSTPPGTPARSEAPRTTGLGQPVPGRSGLRSGSAPGTNTAGDEAGPFRFTAPPAAKPPPARRRGLARVALGAGALVVGAGVWVAVARPDLTAFLPNATAATETSAAPDPEITAPDPDAPLLSTADIPPPDISTREGFLADFADARPCAYTTRITAGADNGRLAVLAGPGAALPGLSDAYGEAFGVAPDIVEMPVVAVQCPVLDVTRALQGRAAVAPTLILDTVEAAPGGTILGRIGQVRGRSIWLVLVTSDGQVLDLSSLLESQSDGSLLFAFTLAGGAVPEPAPQLLMALASPVPILAAATATPDTDPADLMARVLPESVAAGAVAQVARFVVTP